MYQVHTRRRRVLCEEARGRHVLSAPPRLLPLYNPCACSEMCAVMLGAAQLRSLHRESILCRLTRCAVCCRRVTSRPTVATARKVSSTVKLVGLRYGSLTDKMKRSIEKSIQLELQADSVTAWYEPDNRHQSDGQLAAGDTIVKWEAVFHSAAAASAVREGDPRQFEQGLATRLNSETEFWGVTAKAEPFSGPNRRLSLLPRPSVPATGLTTCGVSAVYCSSLSALANSADVCRSPRPIYRRL